MKKFSLENEIIGTLVINWDEVNNNLISVTKSDAKLEHAPSENFPEQLLSFLKNHTKFKKAPIDFSMLDLSKITEFRKKTYKILFDIETGTSLSYGELAKLIDSPKASRAVGSAMAANPFLLVIPCHRVLAANKKIGGFSGGIGNKEILLEAENIKYHK